MLAEMLIASVCASSSHVPACTKASEAALVQTGHARELKLFEDDLTRYLNSKGEFYLGSDNWKLTITLTALASKIVREHALEYRIPVKKQLPVDYIQPGIRGIGQSDLGGSLGVGWSW